jgi:hypothetical protein
MSQVEVCLEQAIIIVLSLHLEEPLVMDLTMLSFINFPYIVLHHNFQFFCLIASRGFRYARYVHKLCKNGMYKKNIVTLC